MAASIAGVLWQTIRLICECHRGAVCSGSLEPRLGRSVRRGYAPPLEIVSGRATDRGAATRGSRRPATPGTPRRRRTRRQRRDAATASGDRRRTQRSLLEYRLGGLPTAVPPRRRRHAPSYYHWQFQCWSYSSWQIAKTPSAWQTALFGDVHAHSILPLRGTAPLARLSGRVRKSVLAACKTLGNPSKRAVLGSRCLQPRSVCCHSITLAASMIVRTISTMPRAALWVIMQ